MKVHERLRRVRESKNLSQAEFAEHLGVSAAAYGRLERGETMADLDQLQRFAERLDLPITEFLPESIIFNNHHDNKHGYGGASVVAGNCYNYIYTDQHSKELEQENTHLKEKITLLEEQLRTMRALIDRLGGAN